LTGHSEEEVEQAVKNVLKQTLGDDVEVFCATADAGGNETTRLTPTLSNSQTIIVYVEIELGFHHTLSGNHVKGSFRLHVRLF
jgi:hypothetical protein